MHRSFDHQKGKATCVFFKKALFDCWLCNAAQRAAETLGETHRIFSLITEVHVNIFPPFPLLIYLQHTLSPHTLQLLAALLLPWLCAEPHPPCVPRPGKPPHTGKEKLRWLPVFHSPQQFGSCWPRQPRASPTFCSGKADRFTRHQGAEFTVKIHPLQHSAGC